MKWKIKSAGREKILLVLMYLLCFPAIKRLKDRIKKRNVKIVKVMGGLGNQLFDYAFFLSIREKNPDSLCLLDTSCYDKIRRKDAMPLSYELERVLRIQEEEINLLTDNSLLALFLRMYMMLPNASVSSLHIGLEEVRVSDLTPLPLDKMEIKKSAFYWGYWESERYFKEYQDIIRKEMVLGDFHKEDKANLDAVHLFAQTESVSVHIRTFRYTFNGLHIALVDTDYYKLSIRYVREKIKDPVFYIFSDDVAWCQENLLKLGFAENDNIVFLNHNMGKDSYKDLQLLSKTKHSIISNSTFAWWGAWLNENEKKTGRIVCYPEYRMMKEIKNRNTEYDTFEVPEWYCISVRRTYDEEN